MHTDNLLEIGSQLVDRGFLPQAGEVERSVRTNLTELADRVTHAADSVLGSQADALRYAQTELDDLSRQLEREIGGGTNAVSAGSTPSQTREQTQNGGNPNAAGGTDGGAGNTDQLRQIAESLGQAGRAAGNGGPITGNNYAAWSRQLRDVESVLDSPDLRNQLAAVRDRVGAFRAEYRNSQRAPSAEIVREQLLMPLSQVQVWVREELARQEKSGSLVPLDRDPVPENYSELVRKYYEKLGNAP
jgi:hypothetical protein